MSVEFTVPELGESVVEATVVKWLKNVGDPVRIGDALVELETEKANFEVAAEKEGILTSIKRQENEDVEVGDVLGVIEVGDVGDIKAPEPKKTEEAPKTQDIPEPTPTVSSVEDQKITPVAKRIAEENKVDISQIEPTGTSNRITKEDVNKFIESRSVPEPPVPNNVEPLRKDTHLSAPQDSPLPLLTRPGAAREERIKLSRRRRTIARRMLEASQTTAMLSTFNEIDMSAVMDLRKRRKEAFKEKTGVSLGLSSFFVKASVGALRAFPYINAEIDGDDVILKNYYDIGVAIGASQGLVVPVLRDADTMTFAEIEKGVREFAEKAENNDLTLEDLMGGTFTITNGGVFGSLMSTPILNPPQVGILGLHKIEKRPVVVDDQITVRPMMYVALSYDHRIVDGREAVQFLVKIKELIEEPETLLIEG